MKYAAPIFLMFVALFIVGLSGCASDTTEPTGAQTPSPGGGDTNHADGDQAPSDAEEIETAMAKLSAEDAASAKKQEICPVSGEMLGSMGAPKKVDVKGQQVWICCDGCKKPLEEKPDEYLAKLKEK